MKNEQNSIRRSASDLSNHLDCLHLTTLEYSHATGRIPRPDWTNPDTAVLQQLGFEHERRYLGHLAGQGLRIVDLRTTESGQSAVEKTHRAMRQGADVITQAVLANGRWFGRADVLQRVETPSDLGAWSYEVYDCKLARETKASTILQLSLYSDLLTKIQGCPPRLMYVVSPSELFNCEPFLVNEYAAYYRFVKTRLEHAIDCAPAEDATAGEPNPHCDVCPW
jgi:predicted RecB family nuclease